MIIIMLGPLWKVNGFRLNLSSEIRLTIKIYNLFISLTAKQFPTLHLHQ